MSKYQEVASQLAEYIFAHTRTMAEIETLIRPVLLEAHRNGLLEAAEQDMQASMLLAINGSRWHAVMDSIDRHRQAADKVKG